MYSHFGISGCIYLYHCTNPFPFPLSYALLISTSNPTVAYSYIPQTMGGTTRNLAKGGVPGAPPFKGEPIFKGIIASAKIVGRDAGYCEDNGFDPDCDENYNWNVKVDADGCASGKYVDNYYAVPGDQTSTLIEFKGDIDCAFFGLGQVIISGKVTAGDETIGDTFAAAFKVGGIGGPQYTDYETIGGLDCSSFSIENFDFIPLGEKGSGQNSFINPPEGDLPQSFKC